MNSDKSVEDKTFNNIMTKTGYANKETKEISKGLTGSIDSDNENELKF